MVVKGHGPDAWTTIREKAGLADEVDFFASDSPYPDELTVPLVIAAAEVLELPVETVLEAFGEYWILYTAREGYGALIEAAGSSVEEFLRYLPNLHSRIKLTHPELTPPSFTTNRLEDGRLELEYRSHRGGLEHFVVGLLRGLAKRFDQSVEIEMEEATDAEGGFWRFLIVESDIHAVR